MSRSHEAFYQEFFHGVLAEAEANEKFAEDAFFELFCEQLMEAGEIDSADRARYVGSGATRGVRVDGFAGHPAFNDGVLTLILADFVQSDTLGTLTRTDLDAIFKRGLTFAKKSLESQFRGALEETSSGFALAETISRAWETTTKLRLLVISNRVLSARVDSQKVGVLDGRPVVHSVWDIERLAAYVASGRSREEMLVSLEEHGGAVPVLPAHLTDARYESYLLVIRGDQLASIYDRWGARLLEQNVRVFLQAKGGVNKGIRRTLEDEPEMFFAYNNGITATAEGVVVERTPGGPRVREIRNLQIVNGAQTTASIYAASTAGVEGLDRVFVQMKLSVIEPREAEEVVPRISEYANSQNKVNAADFFANHPFHIRFKQQSERILAPAKDGTLRGSRWFYERARGQYQDVRGKLSVADRKRFDLENPKTQLITKTDLAKALMVWRELPHIVSRGAQKNFAEFAKVIGDDWEKNEADFNDGHFTESVAKVIIFNELEQIVSREPWYEGGYRANIVAYAIARLAHAVRVRGMSVDFHSVWRAQTMPGPLREALRLSAERMMDVLVNPDPSHRNVTEWAKQEACWSRAQKAAVPFSANFDSVLISLAERALQARDGRRDQRVLAGIEAQAAVVNAGSSFWADLFAWNQANRLLSPKEVDALRVAVGLPNKVPSERQSGVLLQALERAQDKGFEGRLDAVVLG